MNLERRVGHLEAESHINDPGGILTLCSNVKNGNYPSPEEQLERARAAGQKKIFIHKYCGKCNEFCKRRSSINEPEKQN